MSLENLPATETQLENRALENEHPLRQLMDWLETLPISTRTLGDLEAQIAEERDSWND